MRRYLVPRSVRGRLLVIVAIVVGGALAAMTIGFNLLLARSLDGDATRLAHSRATTILSTLHVEHGHVVVSEIPDDQAIESQTWIFNGTRALERPRTSLQAARAAQSLALTGRGRIDVGDLRLYGTPITDGAPGPSSPGSRWRRTSRRAGPRSSYRPRSLRCSS